MTTATEITHICIDNSGNVMDVKFTAQLEAIEFYCETKFARDPHHLVGLFTMSTRQPGPLLSPTNDIQQIRRSFKGIRRDLSGKANFASVFMTAVQDLIAMPSNMKKSLLLFVGSPIRINFAITWEYGDALKNNGIAVNIVNFYVLKGDVSRSSGWWRANGLIKDEYHYGREELEVLFVAANNNNNSHIEDVKKPSAVREILSNSILKKDLLYLEKKRQKNAEENVNVEQRLELSHKEGDNVEASGIQNFKKFEQNHNEKNKKSAANDEIVQPPGVN